MSVTEEKIKELQEKVKQVSNAANQYIGNEADKVFNTIIDDLMRMEKPIHQKTYDQLAQKYAGDNPEEIVQRLMLPPASVDEEMKLEEKEPEQIVMNEKPPEPEIVINERPASNPDVISPTTLDEMDKKYFSEMDDKWSYRNIEKLRGFLKERDQVQVQVIDAAVNKLSGKVEAYSQELKTRQGKSSSPELHTRMERLKSIQDHLNQAKNKGGDLNAALKEIKTASHVFDDLINAGKGKTLAQTIRAKFSSKPIADSLSVRTAFKEALQALSPSSEQSQKKNPIAKKFQSFKEAVTRVKKGQNPTPDETPTLRKK